MSEQEEMQRRLDAFQSSSLSPELEQRIITFVQEWAKNVFHVKEAKAHISRDSLGQPQERLEDWEEEGYLVSYEVCLDMPGVGDIHHTLVLVNPQVPDGLEINDVDGGDQGCAVCDHGHIRQYEPSSERDGEQPGN